MAPPASRLAENILGFARVLRAAGMPVGPGKVLDALAAARLVGIERRDDFYWALFSTLVNRRDQRELFDQAFHVFWRNPRLLERLSTLALAELVPAEARDAESSQEVTRRLGEALQLSADNTTPGDSDRPPQQIGLSWSAGERLRDKDFEQMSTAELAEAKRLLKRLRFGLRPLPTRRFRPDSRGRRVDLRATLRSAARGELLALCHESRRRRLPALVLLCDVSGSMSRYSRMLLHFAHALSNDRDRVYTFVFGTRLTNITRLLRYKDVDQSLAKVGAAVVDWDGGTCIGHCLHAFNRDWSRRVLGQGAQVLLISDGLDRDDPDRLAAEAERLHKSCRRLIWLNPLLRYDGFEPRARGVRALLPHVDEFRAAHNIDSLARLSDALASSAIASSGVNNRYLAKA